MVQFCYVRLYLGVETLLSVAMDDMDGFGLKFEIIIIVIIMMMMTMLMVSVFSSLKFYT